MNTQVSHALQSFKKHWDGDISPYWRRVFTAAHAIFVGAGCGWDFCLQSASKKAVIFGGSNRLIWDRSTSKLRVGPAHCSNEFIVHAKTILGEGQ